RSLSCYACILGGRGACTYNMHTLRLEDKSGLPLVLALHLVRLEDLDPVAVWVLNKRKPFHLASVRFLGKGDIEFLQTLTGGINVRNGDTDVAVALGF